MGSTSLVDGQLHVRGFDWGNEDDYLTIGGTVDLRGEAALDLTITGEGDLRAISAFTTGIATEGTPYSSQTSRAR